jgi:DNA-binding NtrC family response regulator
VTVNCAALPAGVVERALFGESRAAGAEAHQPGAFDRAAGGTLLLDEIGELRPEVQSRLLRLLLDQRDARASGSAARDVRLIATTGRDLKAEVESGRFSRDLFHKLSVVVVHAPPLRDRVDDIPPLVEHFIARAASEWAVTPPVVSPAAIEYLRRRPWPGNIRELANAVERAMIFQTGATLAPEDFEQSSAWPRIAAQDAPVIERPTSGPVVPAGRTPVVGDEEVFDLGVIERRMIHRALEFTKGHKAKAAALLGINERTLRNKLKAERAETGVESAQSRKT